MTQAILKAIDTADWDAAFEAYQNGGLFHCCFQASIGPADGESSELFGFIACNREWVERRAGESLPLPKHVLVNQVSFEAVERAVEHVCLAVPPGRWEEMAHTLAEVMDWEFEGYVPWSGAVEGDACN